MHKLTIWLSDEAFEALEEDAEEDHRTPRQQATVIILEKIGLYKPQRQPVAA